MFHSVYISIKTATTRYFLALCITLFIGSSCMSDNAIGDIGSRYNDVYYSAQIYSLGTQVENRVHEVRFMAFNIYSGELKYNEKLEFSALNNYSKPIQMKSDRYDLVFIANESSLFLKKDYSDALNNITNISELKNTPITQQVYTYTSGQEANIPMSCYLPNQHIIGGPNKNPQIIQEVNLIRAFAKLTINFYEENEAPSNKVITSLKLLNIPDSYNIPALPDMYGGSYTAITEEIEWTNNSQNSTLYPNKNLLGTRDYYIPEQLIAKGTEGKSTLIQLAGKNINTKSISILSKNKDKDVPYLLEEINKGRFPIQSELALNSILRNTHYTVNLTLTPPTSKDLEAEIHIKEWDWKESERNFEEVLVKSFSINGNSSPMKEISINKNTPATIKFTITQPIGALWKATLSNGADFQFADSNKAHGQVTQLNEEITLNVVPTAEWNGRNKNTEFYIVVDGEEATLNNKKGLGNRYTFIQKNN